MRQQTKQANKLVMGVTVAPELQSQVADIATARDWSIAQTGGYLIRLGLERYFELFPLLVEPLPPKTIATSENGNGSHKRKF